MARRGWGVSIATAIGVAAGAGAAQLGFGYGLGVITWTPTDAGAADTAWADGLAWATWLAASSTVLGAVCAQRLHQRPVPVTRPEVPTPVPADGSERPSTPATGPTGTDRPPTVDGPTAPAESRGLHGPTAPAEGRDLLGRVAIALGAGLGGLVTVLLVAVPARVAVGADSDVPQRIAAAHTALGILIGVLVALWALRARAAAVNVTATAAWLWLLAVVSVIDGVRVGGGLVGAQLGTWQLDPDHPRYWIGDQLYWPGALLALVPALVIGASAARRAARSPGHRVGAAASGAAGPLLVALAYLSTVPRWSTPGPAQLSTQLIAPYAVIVGVGGSVLAAVLAERAQRHRHVVAPPAQPDPTRATVDVPAGAAEPGSPAPGIEIGTSARRDGPDAPEESGPGDATRVPRVPAPRSEPDLPAHTGMPPQDPVPTLRRARATRKNPRPASD
ncbi:hypothetical protein [Micromonospora sp. WMMD710]|uniref:hypothetical protein n=1 Tax=Micromonospora sp. WMMD710 TaxID=3016085 RepID=UPI002416CCF5|nr:hypothetical protein [Micromonospora sp. WMMD710]MDG4761081.1 hypothetical protein [Micromonospora sp. WMMD710]